MNQSLWYQNLIKPSFAPPAWVFGPAWSVLYVLIAISFGKVFIMYIQKEINFFVLLPFILNLLFNFLFSYLQFKLGNNILAMIDIFLVLGTLIWALVAIFPHAPWVSYMQIPYLAWVAFATVLQVSITYLNW